MKFEITVAYPWPGIKVDKIIVELPEGIPDCEVNNICFDYAIDAMIDRGISWDYRKIK